MDKVRGHSFLMTACIQNNETLRRRAAGSHGADTRNIFSGENGTPTLRRSPGHSNCAALLLQYKANINRRRGRL